MPYSIRAGVRIEQNKNTLNMTIEDIPEPTTVILSVDEVCVKQGETVKKWQKIGENGDLPVYASVSGKIIDISHGRTVIQNDFSGNCENVLPVQKLIKELGEDEIREIMHNSAVITDGQAAFRYIQPAKTVIINLLESEPYVTSCHRLATDFADEVLGGAKILMKGCSSRHCVIAVQSRTLVRALREKIGISKLFDIKLFGTKYPQDDERQIIYALYGKEIPLSEPIISEGYAVFDGACCVDTYRAFVRGIPKTTACITVDGNCVERPKNLCVPVGTPISHIMQYCGVESERLYKVVKNGIMRGEALYSCEDGVQSDTGALIFLSDGFEKKSQTGCIRCGRCAQCCPMYLVPYNIVKGGMTGTDSCISCGVCSYVCPANIPLTQMISRMKK